MTPEEMNRFAIEKIINYHLITSEYVPGEFWSHKQNKMFSPMFRPSDWNPYENRNQADMCLSRFWDKWEIRDIRAVDGKIFSIAEPDGMKYSHVDARYVRADTFAAAHLKLAIAIYKWMEAHEPERFKDLLEGKQCAI